MRSHGAADADTKAARLGAHDGELQLGATALEVIPDDLAFLDGRAVGAEAKEEVARGAVDAGGGKAFVGGGVFGHGQGFPPVKGLKKSMPMRWKSDSLRVITVNP